MNYFDQEEKEDTDEFNDSIDQAPDEETQRLIQEYDLDEDEARDVEELMDEGLDEDEAVELAEWL